MGGNSYLKSLVRGKFGYYRTKEIPNSKTLVLVAALLFDGHESLVSLTPELKTLKSFVSAQSYCERLKMMLSHQFKIQHSGSDLIKSVLYQYNCILQCVHCSLASGILHTTCCSYTGGIPDRFGRESRVAI